MKTDYGKLIMVDHCLFNELMCGVRGQFCTEECAMVYHVSEEAENVVRRFKELITKLRGRSGPDSQFTGEDDRLLCRQTIAALQRIGQQNE